MEEFIRISAKSVEDAILEASIELRTTRENIEYKVIEYETKGFLGIGAKKAVIEARKKESFDEENIIKAVFSEKSAEKSASSKKQGGKKNTAKPKTENAPEKEKKKAAKKDPDKAKDKPKEKKAEKQAEKQTEKQADKQAEKQAGKALKAEKQDKQVKAEKETEAAEKEKKPEKTERTREPADPKVAVERAESFLDDVFRAMDLEVDKDIRFNDDTLSVELSGEDMGVLIGKRGQTLDSIQYLTSLVVNKGKASYVRVKVDTENYRERRKATLENLAKNIAFKVKKTRKNVYLEPMNPYERRIIHSALQNDPYVTTHSEGEEPLRKVVVTLKKREKPVYEEDE